MTPDEIIAAVHAKDVARARVIIRAAIEAARAQWVPVDAIGDAMADEFMELYSLSCAARPERANQCKPFN